MAKRKRIKRRKRATAYQSCMKKELKGKHGGRAAFKRAAKKCSRKTR